MTTDTAPQLTNGEEQTPEYITKADLQRHIAALQSAKDRELAEERALTDEYAQRVRDLESRIEQAELRGLQDDDPRLLELHKKLRAAEKKAGEYESLVKRFSGSYKAAIVELEAMKIAPTDEDRRAEIARALMVGKSEQEVRQLAQQFRLTGAAKPSVPPPPRERDEIDAGRAAGRTGSVRVTQSFLQEVSRIPGMYTKYKDAIEAALAKGPIPER